MFDDFQRTRPTVLDRVPQAMQGTYAWIAAPGKHQSGCHAHADQLIVEQVGGHADESEIFAALPDYLMPGGKRDEMSEAFHCYHVAVFHQGRDGFRQTHEPGHCFCPETDGNRLGCRSDCVRTLSSPQGTANTPPRRLRT
jgi:hypothetical protein